MTKSRGILYSQRTSPTEPTEDIHHNIFIVILMRAAKNVEAIKSTNVRIELT